jgi:hypothetical protein
MIGQMMQQPLKMERMKFKHQDLDARISGKNVNWGKDVELWPVHKKPNKILHLVGLNCEVSIKKCQNQNYIWWVNAKFNLFFEYECEAAKPIDWTQSYL